MKFDLSYIIATRNRLPFLKVTIQKLLDNLQPGEEIVVVDGNSTDGSKAFLEQLFNDNKIHQYLSEPDKNQAHAWNKAMLMAKGTIIKKIIDDDVFCYEAIQECKNYMLTHPAADVLISNDLSSQLYNHTHIDKHTRQPQMAKWKNGEVPSFTFGDVHMLIRKSALAYIGLYNTAYVMMDWEYSLRISYLKANIVYYTGYNALSVGHPETVSSLRNYAFIDLQGKRAMAFYEYAGDAAEISLWSKIKIFVGKNIKRVKSPVGAFAEKQSVDINSIYNYYYDYLSKLNKLEEFTFIDEN